MNDQHPTDAELLARLRAADPAAELPPADPVETDRVLQRVVDVDLRETGTRKRNPLTWLVAAAAVVVIAVGLTWWLSDDGSQPGGVVAGPGAESSAAAGTTELGTASAAGRCMVPSAELLAAKPTAFAGTVVGIVDGVVTIRTTKVYAGHVGAEVKVRGVAAPGGGVEGDPAFEPGQSYLVAATEDQVVGCGMSGPVSPQLTRLYDQAFGQ